MEAKFVEGSSRESSRYHRSKEVSRTRAASRAGSGYGGGSSGVWPNSQEGQGKRRKSGHRPTARGKSKKRRHVDPAPKHNVSEDRSSLILTRHIRDNVEVWEDLVVDKGDKKFTPKHSGKMKLKKFRLVHNSESAIDCATKNGDTKKEKVPYHIRQVSKETIDRDNGKPRNTEKTRKLKELPKAILIPEAQSTPRLKGSRQKTISSESRFKTPPKIKRDEKRDRTDRSLTHSTEQLSSKEESQRNIAASLDSRDGHKICDRPRSLSLLGESDATTLVTLGDMMCVGDTQTEDTISGTLSKWQLSMADRTTPDGSKGPQDAVWNVIGSDDGAGNDSRPDTRVSRTSRSTCRGGSGDDISHLIKGGSLSSVSRLSTDTCDSPNRALTPGLTMEERADLEAGSEAVFSSVEPNVRVRSSTNPRHKEESSFSTRSRSVSAGTSITRNRYKKLTRKRRGSTSHSLRCNDPSARSSRSPIIRSDIPVKLSPTGSKSRKTSPNPMVAWDKTYSAATNRKNSKEHKTKRFHKPKTPSPTDARHSHKLEVRMSLDDVEDFEENMNDLDWKLDFAMEAALRVAGLRESDSQADSSPTLLSSQECESLASKDDLDSKDSAWCPFVRRPLSAVPEEDSHCSSSNKENPKSEFDLEFMIKHRALPGEENTINAVLDQIFREGSRDIISSEYERTLTDTTDMLRASPSTLTLMPKSSDTMNILQTRDNISSAEQMSAGFTSMVQLNLLQATSTLTSLMPRTTESDSRSDIHQTTQDSSEAVTENVKCYVQENSIIASLVNTLESNDTNSTRNLSTASIKIKDENNSECSSQPKENLRLVNSTETICNKGSTVGSQKESQGEIVKDTDRNLVKEKENETSDSNDSQTNFSKPGVFIALDTLLMEYEKSYSSSSADILLDSKAKKSKHKWLDEVSKENHSSSSSRSQYTEISDNTFENIKSIPKSTENADNATDSCGLQNNSKVKSDNRITYEVLEADRESFQSDTSILHVEQSGKHKPDTECISGICQEMNVKQASSSTSTSCSNRKIHSRVSRKKVTGSHKSANYFLPPKDTITLPSTSLLPLPDRFVVQDGGTFKEPCTPFKFVLTVNLHGPTHLDSSVDASDDCDRDSSSSRSSRDRSSEKVMVRKTRRKDGRSVRRFSSDVPKLSAHNTNNLNKQIKALSPTNTPCSIFLENFEHLHKGNFTSSSGYACDSELSDSDRPSTIPSVLNLEDLDEERSAYKEGTPAQKPDTETIECISCICQEWRNSLGKLVFSDEESAGYLSHQKQNNVTLHQSALPVHLEVNSSVPVMNENIQLQQNTAELKTLEKTQQKTRRRVSLKLFSDWDIINSIIEQGNMGGYIFTKDKIPGDIASTTSSLRKSSTSTVSYRGSLKRKRPSKSSREEWDVISHLKEIIQESAEDNSSPSSISRLLSVSGTDDGSKGLDPFHFLPRLVRQEIARDKKTIKRQEINDLPLRGSNMSDDRGSEISRTSRNISIGGASSSLLPIEREDSILAMQNELDNEINELILNNKNQVDASHLDDSFYRDLFCITRNELLALNDHVSGAVFDNNAPILSDVGEEITQCDLKLNERTNETENNDNKSNLENSTKEQRISESQSMDFETILEAEENDSKQKESTADTEYFSFSHDPLRQISTHIDSLYKDRTSYEQKLEKEYKKQNLKSGENIEEQIQNSEKTLEEQNSISEGVKHDHIGAVQTKDTANRTQDIVNRAQDIANRTQDIVNRAQDIANQTPDTANQMQDTVNQTQDMANQKQGVDNQTQSQLVPISEEHIKANVFVQNQDGNTRDNELQQANETDHSEMNRAIWEGVALTVLLDAASVINKIMNNASISRENKPGLHNEGQNSIEIGSTQKQISIESQENEEAKENTHNGISHPCDKEKILDKSQKSSSIKKITFHEKEIVPDCATTESKSDVSSTSTETTDQLTSTDSKSTHEPNAPKTTTQSRNISVYLPSSVWEDRTVFTDSVTDDKTGSSTTRKTSNEDIFVHSRSLHITIERHTSTQTTTSDWETISQSLGETGEGDKESMDSKSKVLESLWRRSSQRQSSDWDTSTETLGLIRPMASFASAPPATHPDIPPRSNSTCLDSDSSSTRPRLRSCVSAIASTCDEMQLVYMREDVRFTESEDSAVRCYTWGGSLSTPPPTNTPSPIAQPYADPSPKPSLHAHATLEKVPSLPLPPPPPPPTPPPPLLPPPYKVEADQIAFPDSEIDTPPAYAPPPEWSDNTPYDKSETKDERELIAQIATQSQPSRLPASRTKFTALTRESPMLPPEDLIFTDATSETSELDTETTLAISSESAAESDSDVRETLEVLRHLGRHSRLERRMPIAWQSGLGRAYGTGSFSRQNQYPAYHVTLNSNSKHRDSTDVANSVIAFVCLVLAVVLMNSILCANNIIVFK